MVAVQKTAGVGDGGDDTRGAAGPPLAPMPGGLAHALAARREAAAEAAAATPRTPQVRRGGAAGGGGRRRAPGGGRPQGRSPR